MNLFVNCDALTYGELKEFNELLIKQILQLRDELKTNKEKLEFLEAMLKGSDVIKIGEKK